MPIAKSKKADRDPSENSTHNSNYCGLIKKSACLTCITPKGRSRTNGKNSSVQLDE